MTSKTSKTKYGLPTEVVFCKRCVISNQRPGSTVEFKNVGGSKKTLPFGKDGVCDACKYTVYKEKKIDWDKREKELIALCDKYRRDDGYYDCIVPGSGGKDSIFTSHILKYKYGMNPLTVTWAPHLYTDVGWKNLMSWIHVGGLDNILVSPNGHVHSFLARLAFLNLLHPFQPFIVGQRHTGPKTAVLYNVPLVFYGENQAEYVNPIEENKNPTMKKKFFSDDERNLGKLFLGGISAQNLINDGKMSLKDLNPYLPAKKEDIERVGVEVHYLGYYLRWDPQENYYYAAKHAGFQANDERTEGCYSKYSSIDDKVDNFHYYTSLIKFGLGRASNTASQEIRNNKITRDEGVALVRKFDQEFPKKYFKEFLDYINITEDQFFKNIDAGRSPHLWEKNNGEWCLKHQVVSKTSSVLTVHVASVLLTYL